VDDRIRGLAQRLWDYHHVNHQLARADAIVVLCSHDKTVAKRGAALFLEGWAPLLIFAGGLGAITRHLWQEPEADQFAAIAVAMGVPKERILVENRSTNTGEHSSGYSRRRAAPRSAIHPTTASPSAPTTSSRP